MFLHLLSIVINNQNFEICYVVVNPPLFKGRPPTSLKSGELSKEVFIAEIHYDTNKVFSKHDFA